MLILTRRVGETVIIGDDISIKILGIRGNQVRLGIEAPKTIPVHRSETYDKINRNIEKDINKMLSKMTE